MTETLLTWLPAILGAVLFVAALGALRGAGKLYEKALRLAKEARGGEERLHILDAMRERNK